MRIHQPSRKMAAFTLIELIAAIAVMAVLVGLLVPWSSNAPSRRTSCARYLKLIGLATQLFASDNEDKFPWQVSTNAGGSREFQDVPNSAFRHFQVMSDELSTPKMVVCPEDKKRTCATNWAYDFSNQNLSYFVRLNASQTNANSFLSGDRYLTASRIPTNGVLELTANEKVRWTRKYHDYHGYLLLGDGSVQQVDSAGLQRALGDSGVVTNRLAFP